MKNRFSSTEEWRQANEILATILEAPRAKQKALLRKLAADNELIVRELERLLELQDKADHVFERALVPSLSTAGAESLAGRQIGPYRALYRLDRGGMGEVYVAVRVDDFEQLVAIKVIRTDLRFDEALRRFENERQLLARVAHPSIARLLDGGDTNEGLPYLVMEFVEGEPIDRHCDDPAMPTRERIRLFQKVCHAVAELHRNLIIHRDLKPSNVLVTAGGEPKLLDFGIAKDLSPAASPHAALTQAGQSPPMTLLYASPEQVQGESLTTVSDVYSLGVLLYRILTGRLPYEVDLRRHDEVSRAICEQEPVRPGKAAGDIGSILLKALRKRPASRYRTVDDLSDDLDRYLDGYPVRAREGGLAYRAGKFMRRRKLAVAFILLLVLSLVSSLSFWSRAVVERDQAVQEWQRAETIADFLDDLFKSSQPNADRESELTARQFLDFGRQKLLGEVQNALDVQAELAGTLAETYRNLGYLEEARELFEREIRLRRELSHGEDDPLLAKGLNNLGGVLYRMGHYDRAESLFIESLAMRQRLQMEESEMLVTINNLASIATIRGDFDTAEARYREALEKRRRIHGSDSVEVANNLYYLGFVELSRNRLDEAELLLKEALAIMRRHDDVDPNRVASVLGALGLTLMAQNRLVEAGPPLEEALAVRQRVLREPHLETARSQKDLAVWLVRSGRAEAAHALLLRARATTQEQAPENRSRNASMDSALGECLVALGRYAEAEPLLVRSYEEIQAERGAHSFFAIEAKERVEQLYKVWRKPDRLRSPFKIEYRKSSRWVAKAYA
ncbi:MAG TPA: serine/threonine-protein kinase [Thermoanaerobaculia bacterium]